MEKSAVKFITFATQDYNGKTRYGFVANNGYTTMFAFADDEYRRCEVIAKDFSTTTDERAASSAKAYLASNLADCYRRIELIEKGDKKCVDNIRHIEDIIETNQKLMASI